MRPPSPSTGVGFAVVDVPPPPEREPPPDRCRLRPPPERGDGVGAGAAVPGGARRVSPMAGRVSPIFGRSAGPAGDGVGAGLSGAVRVAAVVVPTAVANDGTATGRGVGLLSADGGASSTSRGAPPPSPPGPERPRPPREPRRRRLPVDGAPADGPPEDSPAAPTGEIPPSAVAVEAVAPLDEPGGTAGRVGAPGAGDPAGDVGVGLGDRGASEAPGDCPEGASDIEFLSETVHDARSMACWARSVPTGTTRPRRGSWRSPSRSIHCWVLQARSSTGILPGRPVSARPSIASAG